jgi:hypothetical protein
MDMGLLRSVVLPSAKNRRKGHRDGLIATFAYLPDARVATLGQVLNLRWKDVKHTLHGVPFATSIKESLQRLRAKAKHQGDDDYVFPSQKGQQPLSRIQAYRIMRALTGQKGVTWAYIARSAKPKPKPTPPKNNDWVDEFFNSTAPIKPESVVAQPPMDDDDAWVDQVLGLTP